MLPTLPPTATAAATRLKEYAVARVSIDTRALAAFRIAVGLLIVADILLRARSFGFYYTDTGIVPQELAQENVHEHAISVYFLTSDTTLIAGLMGLQVLIALLLIVGYRTRAATVLSFLFVISLDHHNPFVLSYADTLFRLLLFWAMFLPLGERWSVDAVHAERSPRQSIASVATLFALSQMVVMYFVNGIHKIQSDLWTSGEAAPLVFGIDEMTFLLGDTMRHFPILLEYGGLLWFYILLGSWLLILLPGRPRFVLVGLFFGGHAAFALTVRIGAFAYVAMAGLLLFLQAPFWNDANRLLRYAGIDSDALVPRERLEDVASLFPSFRLLSGRYAGFKEGFYNGVMISIVLAIGLILVVLFLNFGAIFDEGYDQHQFNDEVADAPGGEYVYTVAATLNVRQPEWSVFAPHPRTTDRYYIFAANTTDGERLDVYNDREFTWDRPYDELQKQHGTYRQRFFMNSIRRSGPNDELPANYGEHICETYAEEHGVELEYISMFEITEDITRETIANPEDRESERDQFYRHTCGE